VTAQVEEVRGPRQAHRNETATERADRNMVELLQELRVAQTGVQILFAFLLTLSFTERFVRIDSTQRTIYVVTLVLSALTTVLLVAPVAAHRMMFRRGRKRQLVDASHRIALVGLATLGLSVVGAVMLALDVTIGRGPAVLISTLLGLVALVLWFVVPLPLRRPDTSEQRADQ
jgi:hypothetical protein